MRLKRQKFVKVVDLVPGEEQTVLDVKNLNFLEQHFSKIFEAPNAWFAVDQNLIYRVKKRSFSPKILKASSLTYEPSTTTLRVDFASLVEIAEKYEAEIFELADGTCAIVYPGIVWLAKKEKKEAG